MQRKFIFSEGEYYHLYSRGVDKREIFLDEGDYARFLKLLYIANGEKHFVFRDVQNLPLNEVERGEPLVAIGAYVLMPNHFHILVKEIRKGGVSAYMEKLLTAYSTYFNRRYIRTGSLFESTFRAEHARRDEYLKYLFAYINLNPVKLLEPKWKETGIRNMSRAKKFLNERGYSSYAEHRGVENASPVLTASAFPEYFSKRGSFETYLDDWLKYREVT